MRDTTPLEELQPFPPVSLVLCSRNRPAMLKAVVESILSGDEVPRELVVVDQSGEPHPTLGSLGTRRGCEVVYRWTTSVGLSRSLNVGIAAARHDVLAFTHDDVRVDARWLGTLVRELCAAGPETVVTGRVAADAPEVAGAYAPSVVEDDRSAEYLGRRCHGVLFPQNMAFFRSAIQTAGPFDQRLGPGTPFPAAEDNDLCFRLLDAGLRIRYVPLAIVAHRAWRDESSFVPLRWAYGLGQGAFYAKWLDSRDRFLFWCMVGNLQGHLRRAARLVPRQPRHALSELAYIGGVLAGAARWLATYGATRGRTEPPTLPTDDP